MIYPARARIVISANVETTTTPGRVSDILANEHKAQ
jgi:hypothetical protein